MSCRELGRSRPLFGDVDESITVFPRTDHGAVALRVEYRSLDPARQYTANSVELAADDVDLPGEDEARLRSDIRTRGGLAREPWTLHYGDG